MGLQSIKHFFRRNYNEALQEAGLVHKKTKVAIHEEKAMQTASHMYSGCDVKVTYFDKSTNTFNVKNWNIFGEGILKNSVLIKIEW